MFRLVCFLLLWNHISLVISLQAHLHQPHDDVMTQAEGNGSFCNSHTRRANRTYQPAPDGGWGSLEPRERPKWWRPEGSVLPPHGAKIALAFRGDYHRWGVKTGDYWYNKDNIRSSIVEPLEAAGQGVQFRSYFHTFSDLSCPEYDDKLVRDMNPTLFKFNYSHEGPEYSWVEVLKLVIEDDWADHVLFLRFDVQYNAPITAWNIDWQRVNLNFWRCDTHTQNSDLFVTVPAGKFEAFLSGLQTIRKPYIHIYNIPDIGPIHDIDPIEKHVDWVSLPFSFCGIVRNVTEDYNTCMGR